MMDSESFSLEMPGVVLVVDERDAPSKRYPDGLIILRTQETAGVYDVNLTAMESIRVGMALLERGVRRLKTAPIARQTKAGYRPATGR